MEKFHVPLSKLNIPWSEMMEYVVLAIEEAERMEELKNKGRG